MGKKMDNGYWVTIQINVPHIIHGHGFLTRDYSRDYTSHGNHTNGPNIGSSSCKYTRLEPLSCLKRLEVTSNEARQRNRGNPTSDKAVKTMDIKPRPSLIPNSCGAVCQSPQKLTPKPGCPNPRPNHLKLQPLSPIVPLK